MLHRIVFLSLIATSAAAAQVCTANPNPVMVGQASNLFCTCPAVTGWTSNEGSINGTGNSVMLVTDGVSANKVTVTAICTGAGPQQVLVGISSPPAPPAPRAMSLCSISFERDKKRPARVDNEAKACLDDVALELNRQVDASVVLIGEDAGSTLGGRRAVNTKDYLVKEKGIDASRVKVYSAIQNSKTVQILLVPAGATNPADAVQNAKPVDESKVKAPPRK